MVDNVVTAHPVQIVQIAHPPVVDNVVVNLMEIIFVVVILVCQNAQAEDVLLAKADVAHQNMIVVVVMDVAPRDNVVWQEIIV